MKVLHIINSMGSGGAEKLLSDYLIKSKDDANITHSLYILTVQNNRFLDRLIDNSVNLKISNRSNLYSPLHLIDLFTLIKTEQPNIVHVHLFPAFYYVGLISCLFPNIKFVMTEHNTTNRRRLKRLFKFIEITIYKRFNHIVAISEAVKESLNKWLEHKCEISIIYNGIDFEYFSQAEYLDIRSKYNFQKNSLLVIMVASFTLQKDHKTLIQALKRLPEEYYLLLVGEGSNKLSVQNLVKDLGLSKRVIFMGFQENIAKLYKSSSIAVLSSHYEGFGLAALEAMATNIPLIVSDVSGLSEIVTDKNLRFPVGDSRVLSEKIIHFTRSHIRPNYSDMLSNYSIQAYNNNLLNLYQSLLSS